MDEDLPNRKLPLGQGIVVIPQSKLDPVLAIGGKGGGRGVLLLQALEEHAFFIALDEQRLPGDEAQHLEFPEHSHEILQLRPYDVVEGIEVGFALHGAADDSQGTKALQIVVDGIAGDASHPGQSFQPLRLAVQPGEELHTSAGQDLVQGRGAMRVVEPLEGLRWRRAGQQDLASRPLHQAFILQAGYDPGDRFTLEAQLLIEIMGVHRHLGAGD